MLLSNAAHPPKAPHPQPQALAGQEARRASPEGCPLVSHSLSLSSWTYWVLMSPPARFWGCMDRKRRVQPGFRGRHRNGWLYDRVAVALVRK